MLKLKIRSNFAPIYVKFGTEASTLACTFFALIGLAVSPRAT